MLTEVCGKEHNGELHWVPLEYPMGSGHTSSVASCFGIFIVWQLFLPKHSCYVGNAVAYAVE